MLFAFDLAVLCIYNTRKMRERALVGGLAAQRRATSGLGRPGRRAAVKSPWSYLWVLHCGGFMPLCLFVFVFFSPTKRGR